MNKKIIIGFIFSLCAVFLKADEKLIPEHKDWLDLVSPIITKIEREVFFQLKNIPERNKFIHTFWKQRDPLPDTSENEFQKEYMDRVRFGDFNFGRQSSKKGSRTERGYFYLLLGPPLERQIYATQSDLIPLELWFYKGEQKYGLPSFFYLIFYQHHNIGEYRLYSPGMEGPEKLVSPTVSNRAVNRNAAYQIIKSISGELAGATLSYLPGETPGGTSSFTSDTIIAGIHSLPEKKFPDTYARNFLYYKDFVETEYSHNFTVSNSIVKVFENDGQYFINWALEPSKINFAFYNEKYYAVFQLILRIEDEKGKLVLEKEEEIPITISPENYKKHERRLFSIQDVLPVIPGKYRLIFFLQNKTAKDFTSFQRDFVVPKKKDSPFLSPLLLYHSREELNEQKGNKLKAFAFGGNQYIINAQNNFLPREEIGVFCQVYNLKNIENRTLSLEIFPVNSQDSVFSKNLVLAEIFDERNNKIDSGRFSLSALKPGYYSLKISILEDTGDIFLSAKENFVLLSQAYPVFPLVFSKMYDPLPNPDLLFLIASQYFMTTNYGQVINVLEKSLKQKDEPRARSLLGRAFYGLGQYEKSLTILSPVYQRTQDREIAKTIAVNYVSLKEWAKALTYLEKLMTQAAEVNVLNLAAECYLNLNQPEKALPLLEKSLKLLPDQKAIKELEKKAKNTIK